MWGNDNGVKKFMCLLAHSGMRIVMGLGWNWSLIVAFENKALLGETTETVALSTYAEYLTNRNISDAHYHPSPVQRLSQRYRCVGNFQLAYGCKNVLSALMQISTARHDKIYHVTSILIARDVASLELVIFHIALVTNYDFSKSIDDYAHKIKGMAIMVMEALFKCDAFYNRANDVGWDFVIMAPQKYCNGSFNCTATAKDLIADFSRKLTYMLSIETLLNLHIKEKLTNMRLFGGAFLIEC
ncbi:hypothetical protein ACLB2K_071788 [Fragaria x ananassa]